MTTKERLTVYRERLERVQETESTNIVDIIFYEDQIRELETELLQEAAGHANSMLPPVRKMLETNSFKELIAYIRNTNYEPVDLHLHFDPFKWRFNFAYYYNVLNNEK